MTPMWRHSNALFQLCSSDLSPCSPPWRQCTSSCAVITCRSPPWCPCDVTLMSCFSCTVMACVPAPRHNANVTSLLIVCFSYAVLACVSVGGKLLAGRRSGQWRHFLLGTGRACQWPQRGDVHHAAHQWHVDLPTGSRGQVASRFRLWGWPQCALAAVAQHATQHLWRIRSVYAMLAWRSFLTLLHGCPIILFHVTVTQLEVGYGYAPFKSLEKNPQWLW